MAGIAGALVLGAIASSRYSEATSSRECVNDICTRRGLEERDTASTYAGISTAAFLGGLLLLGSGIALYLISPAVPSKVVTIGPGPAALGTTF